MPPFLSARWRDLVIVSYAADSDALRPYLPPGVELDQWDGRHLVSLLGLTFTDVRVLGMPAPWHRSFPDVNLRLYARRRDGAGRWMRGVVFIKEIVPRRLVAAMARWVFNERFVAHPMRKEIITLGDARTVRYEWHAGGAWQRLAARCSGAPSSIAEGSLEEFLVERRRGFVAQRDGSMLVYAIERPRWRIWAADGCDIRCDAERVYGSSLTHVLDSDPLSVIVAEGSVVGVRKLPP